MKFNLNVIGNIIGILLMINGFLMLTAVPFGIYFNENSFIGILISSFVNIAVGFQCYHLTKNTRNEKKYSTLKRNLKLSQIILFNNKLTIF